MSRFDPILKNEYLHPALQNQPDMHLSRLIANSWCPAFHRLDLFFSKAPREVLETFREEVGRVKAVSTDDCYGMLTTLILREEKENVRRISPLLYDRHWVESLSKEAVCVELLLYAIQAIQRMVREDEHRKMQEELDRRENV